MQKLTSGAREILEHMQDETSPAAYESTIVDRFKFNGWPSSPRNSLDNGASSDCEGKEERSMHMHRKERLTYFFV